MLMGTGYCVAHMHNIAEFDTLIGWSLTPTTYQGQFLAFFQA